MSLLARPCRCGRSLLSRSSSGSVKQHSFSTSFSASEDAVPAKLPARDWSIHIPSPPLPTRRDTTASSSRRSTPLNADSRPTQSNNNADKRMPSRRSHLHPAANLERDATGSEKWSTRLNQDRSTGIGKWGAEAGPGPSRNGPRAEGGFGTRGGGRGREENTPPPPSGFGLRPAEGRRESWGARGSEGASAERSSYDRGRVQMDQESKGELPSRGSRTRGRDSAANLLGRQDTSRPNLAPREATRLSVSDTVAVEGEDFAEESTSSEGHRAKDRRLRHGSDRSYLEEGVIPERGRGKGKSRDLLADKPIERLKKVKKSRLIENKPEKEVVIPSSVSVARLAAIFGVKLYQLQVRMMRTGMDEDHRRPDYILNAEQACDIAIEYGFNPVVDDERAFDIFPDPEPADMSTFPPRPPVVTIMGHVDHGKTTLLDSLRNTAVAAGEAGGITQHIGAFSVPLSSLVKLSETSDATITFLDTPGHAAFTAMRARGASVTDIVVLVVAADDGVMPQTREVIELWKSEQDKVGLVVAINKVDKPGVDVARVKSALGAEGILLEEDGGEIPSVRVSGLTKAGLDDLVETLSTLAELRDLRARQEGKAEGYVLESKVDRGRGNVATVLITHGILRPGASIIAGNVFCRVRQMLDDKGNVEHAALPGAPVSITGWRDLPTAGDQLLEAINGEAEARRAIANRLRETERKKLLEDVEQINVKRREDRIRAEEEEAEMTAIKEAGGNVFQAQVAATKKAAADARDGGKKELRLVIKGDVSGSVEAVVGSLEGIGNKEAGVKIIHTGVGEVAESDIDLAQATEAHVIGFNVACPRNVKTMANTTKTPLHLEGVIYRLIETVRKETAALLPPRIEQRITGEATVLQIFTINARKKDEHKIAGCRAGNGVVSRNDKVRVLRGSERVEIFSGEIETLKHVKKDVLEIRKGMEFGVGIKGFNDLQEGDEVVTFNTVEVPREL